jgi:hypothetical protein
MKLPVLVKGILRSDDALLAVNHGASGVIVSNHGARQLDTTPATISILPEIVDAVGGKVEVYVDGGIRRGTDVLKAIACGRLRWAHSCSELHFAAWLHMPGAQQNQSSQRRNGRSPPLKSRAWIRRSSLSWLTSGQRSVSTACWSCADNGAHLSLGPKATRSPRICTSSPSPNKMLVDAGVLLSVILLGRPHPMTC